MPGWQLEPTIVELTHEADPFTRELLTTFIPPLPGRIGLRPDPPFLCAGFGWLRIFKAGKFCHASRVWFAGQKLICGASNVQAHD